MQVKISIWSIAGWTMGMIVFILGVLNMIFVHPVPGIAYIMLSLVYFPPSNAFFRSRLGFAIPVALKIALAILLFFFTLGVSDLGDMIDDLLLQK